MPSSIGGFPPGTLEWPRASPHRAPNRADQRRTADRGAAPSGQSVPMTRYAATRTLVSGVEFTA